MILISRDRARKRGLKHYYTGELCANGHDDEHYVSTGCCCTCVALSVRGQREKSRAAGVPRGLYERKPRAEPRAKMALPIAAAPSDGFITPPSKARLMAGK